MSGRYPQRRGRLERELGVLPRSRVGAEGSERYGVCDEGWVPELDEDADLLSRAVFMIWRRPYCWLAAASLSLRTGSCPRGLRAAREAGEWAQCCSFAAVREWCRWVRWAWLSSLGALSLIVVVGCAGSTVDLSIAVHTKGPKEWALGLTIDVRCELCGLGLSPSESGSWHMSCNNSLSYESCRITRAALGIKYYGPVGHCRAALTSLCTW